MAKIKQEKPLKITESDLLLPLNIVSKLMKEVLPEGCKISTKTKEKMSEAACEFIGFVINQAAEEHMVKEQRKTITGCDILKALKDVDLDVFHEPMSLYLKQMKQELKSKSKNKEETSEK